MYERMLVRIISYLIYKYYFSWVACQAQDSAHGILELTSRVAHVLLTQDLHLFIESIVLLTVELAGSFICRNSAKGTLWRI